MAADANRIITDGIRLFMPSITFYAEGNGKKAFNTALRSEPRLVFYIGSYNISSQGNRHAVKLVYKNRDVPLSEVHVIASAAQLEKYIATAVKFFESSFVSVSMNKIQWRRVLDSFNRKSGSAYPQLTHTGCNGFELAGIYYSEISFKYRLTKSKLMDMEQELRQELNRISLMLFAGDMPDCVKIYLAHNYLALTVKYVLDWRNDLCTSYTQSAYGALIMHKCVCQGYAEAFARLMEWNNIPCKVVTGHITGHETYHAWNIVYDRDLGSFSHVDVTWDASDESPGYLYFCRDDSYFTGKRSWDKNIFPRCSKGSGILVNAKNYLYLMGDSLIKRGVDRKFLDI